MFVVAADSAVVLASAGLLALSLLFVEAANRIILDQAQIKIAVHALPAE